MGHVKNTNLHRISVPTPGGDVPTRLASGEVKEADGELLDRLTAVAGVETVSKREYDDTVTARRAEHEAVAATVAEGRSYVDPATRANLEHQAAGGGGPITLSQVPTPQHHEGGSAYSDPPVNPRTGEPKEAQSAGQAARFAVIEQQAKQLGVSVEQLVGAGAAAVEATPGRPPASAAVEAGEDKPLVEAPSATDPAAGGDQGDGDLSGHTVKELRAIAAERGVDLGDASRKDDIIEALRGGDE